MKEAGCLLKAYIFIACLILGIPSLILSFSKGITSIDDLTPLMIAIGAFSIFFIVIISPIVSRYKYKSYCKANNIEYYDSSPNIFDGSNSILLCKKNDLGSKIYNYMSSFKNGYKYVIADYAYVYSFSGNTPNTCHNTFWVLSNSNIKMPKFYICPRIISDKLNYIKDFQYNVIDLSEINKDFSEMFILASDNEEAVKEFFTYEICQKFVEFEIRNCFFEGRDNRLLFLRSKELKLNKKIELLEYCENLFDEICQI